MKMEVEAGSSLLHDITKAAARLCVLVCNPFARSAGIFSGLHHKGVQVSECVGFSNPVAVFRATARVQGRVCRGRRQEAGV